MIPFKEAFADHKLNVFLVQPKPIDGFCRVSANLNDVCLFRLSFKGPGVKTSGCAKAISVVSSTTIKGRLTPPDLTYNWSHSPSTYGCRCDLALPEGFVGGWPRGDRQICLPLAERSH